MREADDDERFVPLARGRAYRMGAGRREGDVFLELAILLFPEEKVNIEHLRRCTDCLSALESDGFILKYDGNGSVTAEIGSMDERVDRAARSAVLLL